MYRGGSGSIKAHHDVDDLVQEIYLKAHAALGKFSGRSSLKTFVITVARNHVYRLFERSNVRRTCAIDDNHLKTESEIGLSIDTKERLEDLLSWLRESEEIEHGWEVLNHMIWFNGDAERVSFAVSLDTGHPLTPRKVRAIVAKIAKTEKGKALIEIIND